MKAATTAGPRVRAAVVQAATMTGTTKATTTTDTNPAARVGQVGPEVVMRVAAIQVGAPYKAALEPAKVRAAVVTQGAGATQAANPCGRRREYRKLSSAA